MTPADRQRRYRSRLGRVWMCLVPVSFDMIDFLIDARLLDAAKSQDRSEVGAAVDRALKKYRDASRRASGDRS